MHGDEIVPEETPVARGAKPATPARSRFTPEESERYSAIQSLAVEYFRDEIDGLLSWISCVAKARMKIDAKQP